MSTIKETLANLLSACNIPQMLLSNKALLDRLCSSLTDSNGQGSKEFSTLLKAQYNLNEKAISGIVEKLSLDDNLMHQFGRKKIMIWLRYQLYRQLDILRENEEDSRKREIIAQTMLNFNFQNSSIFKLLEKCFLQTNDPQDQETIKQLEEGLKIDEKKLKIIFQKSPKISKASAYNPNKQIQQELKDLIDDYNNFPNNSFLKQLQKELIISFCLKKSINISSIQRAINIKEFRHDLDGLQKKYKEQHRQLSKAMILFFEALQTSKKQQKYYSLIAQKKTNILSINVFELERLINKTHDAANIIQRKEVIFILGSTGSGKSTNILKLLGYTLQQSVFKGLPTLIPVEQLEENHSTFCTSPEATSCTRYINATKIPYKILKDINYLNPLQMLICDSPGFGDSAGVQVDIANGVGMIKALQNCCSVRMVVIVAYESLVSQRMKGVIQISQIISTLFHDLSEIIDSICILFNKVPQNQIQHIPRQIQSKVQNLSLQRTCDQKFMGFLELLLNQSKEKNHYINPLRSNYAELLKDIIKMPAIKQCHDFRYSFSDKTKKEITNFTNELKCNIKDKLQCKKYQQSSFYFGLLQKLSYILKDNKVNELYEEMKAYIINQSKILFKFYEDSLLQVFNGFNVQKNCQYLIEYEDYIMTFYQKFKGIQVVSYHSLINLKSSFKIRLLNRAKSEEAFTSEHLIQLIKSIPSQFDPHLKKEAFDYISKQINQLYTNIKESIELNNYQSVNRYIRLFEQLNKHIIILGGQSNSKKLIALLKPLKTQVDQILSFLESSIITCQKFIQRKTVKDANNYIKELSKYQDIYFQGIDMKIQLKRKQCLQKIIDRCRSSIRKLMNYISQGSSISANINDSLVRQTKEEIQNLMKISIVKQTLQEQYKEIIQVTSQKLRESTAELNQYIQALKQKDLESLQRKIDIIKRSSQFILKASLIIQDSEGSKDLAQSITQQLGNYIKSSEQQIKSIKTKLNDITNNTYEKISNINKKIYIYTKLAVINKQGIMRSVKAIKRLFFSTLKYPCQEIATILQRFGNQNKKFQQFRQILEKIEKFTLYTNTLEAIFSYEDYLEITDTQKDIWNTIEGILEPIKTNINEFINSQDHQLSSSSRQAVKILSIIILKPSFSAYVDKRLSFNASEIINEFHYTLKTIKEKLELELQCIKNVEHKHQILTKILGKIKYFSEIQVVYNKSHLFESINFLQLQTHIRKQYLQSINDTASQVKSLISNQQVSNINFARIKQIYIMLTQLKSNDGAQNKSIILQQFRNLQDNIINQINRLRRQIQQNQLIKNKQKTTQFIELFSDAVNLQQNLEGLLLQRDRNYIIIDKQYLKNVGNELIEIFTVSFKNILKRFEQYDLSSIQADINAIGTLQNVLYSVILDNNQSQIVSRINNYAYKFRSYIELGSQELKKRIIEASQLQQERPFCSIQKEIKLKKLLQEYYKIQMKKIQGKYNSDKNQIKIDKNFKKYYESLHKSNNRESQSKRLEIQANLNAGFQHLFEKLIKKQTSSQEKIEIQTQIAVNLQHLPLNLSKKIKEEYEAVKIKVAEVIKNTLNDLHKKIIDKPQHFELYFIELQVARNNKSYHQNLIELLQKVYRQKQKTTETLTSKFEFISHYITQVYKKNQHILCRDEKAIKILILKYQQSMTKISNLVERQLNKIKINIQRTLIQKQQSQNFVNSILDVFIIYDKIRDLKVSDHLSKEKDYKIIMNTMIIDKFKEFYCIYTKKAPTKQFSNIIHIDLSDSTALKNMQSYIKYITRMDEAIKTFKQRLTVLSQVHDSEELLNISLLFSSIETSQAILNSYKSQITYYMTILQQFTFYDQRRKNMSPLQLSNQLLQIDKIYNLFRSRCAFFNQYVYNNVESIKINSFQTKFQKLYDQLYQDSIEEIQNTFQSTQASTATRVNVFNNITKIMMEKKIKFASNTLKEKHDNIAKLMRKKFQQLNEINIQNFENANKATKVATEKIKINEEQKNKTVEEVKIVYKEKMIRGTAEIETSVNSIIKAQNDADKRIELENNKKAKINELKSTFQAEKAKKIQQIEQNYDNIMKQWKESINVQVKNLAQSLVQYKKVILDINYDNERQVRNLETFINDLSTAGSKFIDNLTIALQSNESDQQSLGKHILMTHPAFKKYVDRQRREVVQGNDIEYVLQNLQMIKIIGREKLSQKQLSKILNLYKQFKRKYEQYKDYYAEAPNESTIISIATNCRDFGVSLKTDCYQGNKMDNNLKITLLAGIFALWTILKSQKDEDTIVYTVQPHPTQITTLIVLLGISKPQENLSNRLAQVGTGQGKSIVLAGLSCYLGLVGFKVKCACYSSYLSGRDQLSFKDLFQRLGIENQIKYGTFNELCQEILNSGGTNFKSQVEKMLFNSNTPFRNGLSKSKISQPERKGNKLSPDPTILVIDEVDVFFNQSFFGNTYCPGIRLRGTEVTSMLQFVWGEYMKRGDAITPQQLQNSNQFRELIRKYPSLRHILDNQLHGMITGAIAYKHDYFLIDKKLVYKDNDTIAHNINYGYKTVFANLFEYNRGNVSRSNLEQSLEISLMIAQFSYTKLPNYFDFILGVTGTLEVMPTYKKRQLLNRYLINEQYAIPSAFGNNRRRIQNYCVVPDAEYEKTIIEKIKTVGQRPIIIFFKGVNELNDFSQSPLYDMFLQRTYTLTEEHQASVRNARIIKAVNANFITLMTNSFGRGTDFILLDEKIKNRGGLHVIHAFLSHDQSEEIQIKGRTARQSNCGSYDCILIEKFLEQLQLKKQQFPHGMESSAIHKVLLQARERNIERLSSTTMKQVDESDEKHKKVANIFKKDSLTQQELIEYIFELNKYPQIAKINVRTILGIDATGSMGHAIAQACLIIGESFHRAFNVLTSEKVRGSFQIKIMIYRNYDCPFETILESTAFENTSENLRKFLNNVRATGGWGCNEAVELFLQAANREENIDQIILIGDAPPNTVVEVTQKRAYRTENYWNSHNMPITNGDQQIQAFAQKKCPIHTFFLAYEKEFRSISQRTSGKSSPFNVHSPTATGELTNFIVENIIYIVGNKNSSGGGDKLIQTYRKMYT